MRRNDFLFSIPNFRSGMSKVLDMGSRLKAYDISDNPEEEDFKALQSDWSNIGEDIRRSMDEFSTCCKGH